MTPAVVLGVQARTVRCDARLRGEAVAQRLQRVGDGRRLGVVDIDRHHLVDQVAHDRCRAAPLLHR
jgi:hypothetical protein